MSLKFGQVIVANKEFYKVKEITGLTSLNLDNVVVSEAIPANGGKDQKFIVGYQKENAIIPLLVKTPKNIFSTGVTQYNEKSTYTMGLILQSSKIGSNDTKHYG